MSAARTVRPRPCEGFSSWETIDHDVQEAAHDKADQGDHQRDVAHRQCHAAVLPLPRDPRRMQSANVPLTTRVIGRTVASLEDPAQK